MQRITANIRDQRGFTLIEIIMVIVLLGIIAAIAIPKYVDLKADAQNASAQGLKGAIVAAAAIGYADKAINEAVATYPTGPQMDTTYLKSDDLNWEVANTAWTADIGNQDYRFTYYQASGGVSYSQY